jgi:hypothetical protein
MITIEELKSVLEKFLPLSKNCPEKLIGSCEEIAKKAINGSPNKSREEILSALFLQFYEVGKHEGTLQTIRSLTDSFKKIEKEGKKS